MHSKVKKPMSKPNSLQRASCHQYWLASITSASELHGKTKKVSAVIQKYFKSLKQSSGPFSLNSS